MSEGQNVQIVRDCYASFGRGDIQTILNNLSDDVEWILPGEGVLPQGGLYEGPEGVTRFFQTLSETTEMLKFEPREFVAQGDRVVAFGSFKAKAKATGRSAEANWVMSFTFRDGKITNFREYTDTAALAVAYVQEARSASA